MNAVFITVMEALEPIIIILELCRVCFPDPTVLILFFFSISPNRCCLDYSRSSATNACKSHQKAGPR